MIGILTALKEERDAVRRAFEIEPAGTLQSLEMEQGEAVTHLCTGMGADRMSEGVRLLTQLGELQALILVGYSVGLRDNLGVGSLVVDERSSPQLLTKVQNAVPDIATGRIATCDFLGTSKQKKRFANERQDCLIADLESESFLKAAPEQIPRLVVRAVSDDVHTDLPLDFSKFVTPNGFPDQRKLALRLAINPWLLPKLLNLGRDAQKATARLAELLTRMELS